MLQVMLTGSKRSTNKKSVSHDEGRPLYWYLFNRMSEADKQQLIQDSQAARANMQTALEESRAAIERANKSMSQSTC